MRLERETMLEQAQTLLESGTFMLAMNFSGLKAADFAALKKELAQLDACLHVVKNTFLRRAIGNLGWEDPGTVLEGPTAIVTGGGDPAQTAKQVSAFLKAYPHAALKGGCLEGRAMTSEDVDALAKLPAREVMLAIFVGTVAAPMSRLAGVLNQKLLSLPYVLNAVGEKKRGAA